MARERRALPWLVLLLPIGLACPLPTPLGELPASTTQTIDASSSSGGSTNDPGLTTLVPPDETTSGAGPLPMHAWVMRYEDWIALGDDTGVDSGDVGGTGGGTEVSPDALVVQISTAPDDCANPHAPMECGDQWILSFVIPPELQAPGSYDLFVELSGFFAVTGPLEPGDSCSGGAGSLEGIAELMVVSEQEVSGRLSMTTVFDFDANVEFAALGCGL